MTIMLHYWRGTANLKWKLISKYVILIRKQKKIILQIQSSARTEQNPNILDFMNWEIIGH